MAWNMIAWMGNGSLQGKPQEAGWNGGDLRKSRWTKENGRENCRCRRNGSLWRP